MTRAERGLGAQQRLLLSWALGWAFVLCILSATLPVYTVPNFQVGWQPRVTVLTHFGVAGFLPAVGLLLIGAAVGALLWGRRRGLTMTARVVGIVVLVASVASLALLHFVGFAFVPFGVLLLASTYASEPS